MSRKITSKIYIPLDTSYTINSMGQIYFEPEIPLYQPTKCKKQWGKKYNCIWRYGEEP